MKDTQIVTTALRQGYSASIQQTSFKLHNYYLPRRILGNW